MTKLVLVMLFFFRLLSDAKTASEILNLQSKMKVSRLHFYLHDIVAGKNATAVSVAQSAMTKRSRTKFGSVSVMDDPLTDKADINAKTVGYVQGIYSSACRRESRLLIAATFVFTSGKYKGSTVSVLGNTYIFDKQREMPIVGGTGLFRFAGGYTQAHTLSFDRFTGNALVEYNVTIFHH